MAVAKLADDKGATIALLPPTISIGERAPSMRAA
jgi:hypothetical protein